MSEVRPKGVAALPVVLLTAAAVGFGVRGERGTAQERERMEAELGAEGEVYFVGDLMGTTGRDIEGTEIGEIEDVVFDGGRERVSYIVLARGGFLGIDEERYAIPWALVEPHLEEDVVLLRISEELLVNREPLGERWPSAQTDAAAREWLVLAEREQDGNGNGVPNGNGDETSGQEASYDLRRASELVGLEVQLDRMYRENQGDQGGSEQQSGDLVNGVYYNRGTNQPAVDGEIDDLVIGAGGDIRFAVVSPQGRIWGEVTDGEAVAIPWGRIDVMPEQQMAVAHVTGAEASTPRAGETDVHDVDYPYFWDEHFATPDIQGYYDDRLDGVGSPYTGYHNGYPGADSVRRGGDWRDTYQESERGSGGRRTGPPNEETVLRRWAGFVGQCLGAERRLDSSVTGRIRNLGTLYARGQAETDAPSGLRYLLDTEGGERIRVYLGPQAVMTPFGLGRGDTVTVRGMVCQIDGKRVMVAGYLEGESRVYRLVEEGGVTRWAREEEGGTPGAE